MKDPVVLNDEDIDNYIIIGDDERIASDINPLQNEILEIEEVDSEHEGLNSENEGVDNAFLPTERKWYRLRTPPISTKVTKEKLGAPWDGTI